jgi:hypothetical protein
MIRQGTPDPSDINTCIWCKKENFRPSSPFCSDKCKGRFYRWRSNRNTAKPFSLDELAGEIKKETKT